MGGSAGRPRVGLFVTCLVDLFRPSVGFAAVKLLRDAGCDVDVPVGQTCCGQPAYNSGDKATAEDLARQTIAALEGYDYLVDVRGLDKVDARLDARATYHDSCSGLRELGVREQPRQLLRTVKGLELVEMGDAEVCCGFGGTFSVKYPDISNAIVERKAERIAATGAGMLLAGDLGCLMNMAGKLSRQGRKIAVRHVAEVLAGELSDPAICERP